MINVRDIMCFGVHLWSSLLCPHVMIALHTTSVTQTPITNERDALRSQSLSSTVPDIGRDASLTPLEPTAASFFGTKILELVECNFRSCSTSKNKKRSKPRHKKCHKHPAHPIPPPLDADKKKSSITAA